MAVVYLHKSILTKEVFYVGAGKDKFRAHSKWSRSDAWKEKVLKEGGYDVEIVKNDIPISEAKKIEMELIKQYGRIDIGTGVLINLTDGGDGQVNLSPAIRNKITEASRLKRGPYSEERKRNHVCHNRGKKGLQIAWNKGKKMEPYTQERINNMRVKKPRKTCEFCLKTISVKKYDKFHSEGKCNNA